MIDLINEIINKKWNELEKQTKISNFDEQVEKLLEIISDLDSIDDFTKEYERYQDEIEKINVLTEEQIDELFESFYQKWTFIMCAILNLDISNPYILLFMQEALIQFSEILD